MLFPFCVFSAFAKLEIGRKVVPQVDASLHKQLIKIAFETEDEKYVAATMNQFALDAILKHKAMQDERASNNCRLAITAYYIPSVCWSPHPSLS